MLVICIAIDVYSQCEISDVIFDFYSLTLACIGIYIYIYIYSYLCKGDSILTISPALI